MERVSVVMPARDVGRYVEEAVASVHAQTWGDVELIAVDDGSADGTGPILERAAASPGWSRPGRRLVLLRRGGGGAGAARNAGLGRASGGLVAFLDADDRWHLSLLERTVAALGADPGLVLAFPRLRYVDADGAPLGFESRPRARRFAPRDLMIDNPVHSATGVVVRRDAIEAAGGFDESLRSCIDLDCWVRLGAGREAPFGAVDAVLADYRKRPGQITGDWRRMEAGWRRVAEKLAAAGHPLSEPDLAAARTRRALYWSSIAYEAGDHAGARRLLAGIWRRDPGFALRSPLARIRTLAAAASLLPEPAHRWLRRRWNARPGA